MDWNVIQTDPIVLETSDDQYLEAYKLSIFMARPGHTGARSTDQPMIMPGIYCPPPDSILETVPTLSPVF